MQVITSLIILLLALGLGYTIYLIAFAPVTPTKPEDNVVNFEHLEINKY